jgi:hypothetical protein
MSRRPRLMNSFVDESARGSRYFMACVVIEARHLSAVRSELTELVPPGKRVHFYEATEQARTRALDVYLSLPVTVWMAVCVRAHGVTEFRARDECLAELVRRLQADGVERLTIESRQFDQDDVRTIVRARSKEPSLTFDHVVGLREPLLWIADGVGWAYGAGRRWQALVEPLITNVIEIRP